MASLDQVMHVTMTCDTSELLEAILKLKAVLDIRTKCVFADCTKSSNEHNQIETHIYKDRPYMKDKPFPVHVYVCDEHYRMLNPDIFVNAPVNAEVN